MAAAGEQRSDTNDAPGSGEGGSGAGELPDGLKYPPTCF